MSQMMASARNENQGIALNCPHCKFTCRHDVSHVEDCIKLHEPLVCVACGGEFNVLIVSQTRVAEQRDGAAEQDGALAHTHEDIPGVVEHIEELWEE